MPNHDPVTGKFAPGNKASPGRKPRKVEDAFIDAIIETARKEGQAISAAMAKAAKAGDVAAARFLAEYSHGKPAQQNIPPELVALIIRLVKYYEARGVSAGDAFAAMIELEAQLAEAQNDDEL